MTSPTQRSLKYLRAKGYLSQVVEHYNVFSRKRQDLLGFIDIFCLGDGIIGVQTTSAVNISARKKKILSLWQAKLFLKNGGKIFVHGWSKKGKTGKRKLWTLREIEITLDDFVNQNS